MNTNVEFFILLESQIWDSLVRGDKISESQLIADDFLGVYETGYSNKAEYLSQLDRGPSIHRFIIFNPRLLAINSTNVALTYQVDFMALKNNDPEPKQTMYVTSIWSLRSENWVNIFSQDTLASQC